MIVDTTVVNIHHGHDNYVLIGRPSIFGNPYVTGSRTYKIEQYRIYFLDKIRAGACASFKAADAS